MCQSPDSEEGGKLLSTVVALHWAAAELYQHECFTVELVFSRQLVWWEHSVTLFSSSPLSLFLSPHVGCEQGWKGVLQL